MAKLQASRIGPGTRSDRQLNVREFAKVFDHGPSPWHLATTIWIRSYCCREEVQKEASHSGGAGWRLEDSLAFEEFAKDSGVRCVPVRGPVCVNCDSELGRDCTLIADGVYRGGAGQRAVDVKDDQVHALAAPSAC